MNESCFQASELYRAMTLMERISLLKDRGKVLNVTFDTGVAERRMTRWRSQHPFTKESFFSQRLSIAGVKEHEFLHIIGGPADSLYNQASDLPSWLIEICEAFFPINDGKKVSYKQRGDSFLAVIQPLIDWGVTRLHDGINKVSKINNPPFDLSLIEDMFISNLQPQLLKMLNRTLIMELNISRLQGTLHGDTAEERFKHFIQSLCQVDSTIVFLQEYPVLARQLTQCIDLWVKFSLDFLTHLCNDWEAICKTFSANHNPGMLVQLQGLGDRHQGGRVVLLVKFSSGLRIVYKPRSLSIDIHFNKLLDWINERGDHPGFRTTKVIDRISYGWVEFIAAENCTSENQIKRFYERQGGYLALLYALEAQDFHFENLVAAGEHPVLLDLEALFHPRIGDEESQKAHQHAVNAFTSSVLRIGLLPLPTRKNDESKATDCSGLGAKEGQLTPLAIPVFDKIGTDEMRLIRKKIPMMGHNNRPTIVGISIDLKNYVDSLMVGFSNIYRLFLTYRHELLSNDGPLTSFADDETRVILRATQTYSTLLDESYHPDVLRDALDRDQLFDKLWISVEHLPYLSKVIPAEQRALQNGEIPKFTTKPNSRDLWTCTGQSIVNFLDKTGLEHVHERIKQLSEDDLEKQLWFIRASIATTANGIASEKRYISHSTTSQNIVDHESLFKAAQAVGDRLERLAFRSELDASWIGLTRTAKENWSLLPLGMDLYDGVPGVALFLAYLGEITSEKHYTLLAEAALKTIEDYINDDRTLIKSIGGFSGWGGIIYTLTHLGVLWNKPQLIAKSKEIVNYLPDLIEQDDQFDIIHGAAGCIGSLIALYRIAPSNQILNTAIQCGNWLVTNAEAQERGVGWPDPVFAKKPLTGFSHGAAGIAWALLELAELTGHEHFRKTAIAAIDYERSLFSRKEGNWPDLREIVNSKQSFSTTWCHGAPGIGLSRLYILRYLDDKEIYPEINAALRNTLSHGFFENHSLCHGDLGNLELLVQAREKLNDKKWNSRINDITAKILNSIENNGLLCGNPLKVEAPGLMTGIAGIGFGLLRLAEPSRVPSVLMLEPPLK
ncbi:type 2 lanthipeptide synthetase LanM family protein [Peribacillus frigoritolerans]|uniref:type 2 lanthipeptide synthetase LanM family protein n=1 Tax=Peribacillus frigoritolerans TaxID=450367 RepID=UPI003D050995